MQKTSEVLNSMSRTLQKRRDMSSIIENALRESPKDMDRLLAVVSELYYSGNIPRFWDVLAILAGADRGWGNDWFFTALEIQERFRLEGGDNNGR